MESISVVLVVAGRVRRGVVHPLAAGMVDCEGCDGRLATVVVRSPKGRETWLCDHCLASSGEPIAPEAFGQVWTSTDMVRSAIAKGQQAAKFEDVERYMVAKARWDKQTKAHGFKRPPAAKANATRGLWHPYWVPEKGR